MKIKLLLVLFLSLFFIGSTNAAEEKKVIRVAISNQNFSNYDYQNIKISSSNLIKIIDISQSGQIEPIEANSVVEIIFNNGLYNILVNFGNYLLSSARTFLVIAVTTSSLALSCLPQAQV